MALDKALLLFGVITEAALFGLLIFRRVYRTLPLFSFYLLWSAISDLGQYFLAIRYPDQLIRIYFISVLIDSIYVLSILVELTISVLRPVRASLSRWAILAVPVVIAVGFAAIWPFTKPPGFSKLLVDSQHMVHLSLTVTVVRIVYFLALAGLSQLLSIGWKDRELQIATGFGFYSVVSLSVAVLHMNMEAMAPQYHSLEQLVSISYICSMLYWFGCFLQKAPERREFTPQMQSFLLAVAGNARSTRIAMTNSSDSGKNQPVGR